MRPIVRNMRGQGYIMQTGGSATRRKVQAEGTEINPVFRITGVPRHTHNASALLVVEVAGEAPKIETSDRIESLAEEWSVSNIEIKAGDTLSTKRINQTETIQSCERLIEFGIGTIQIKPENCKNHISEPTRCIAEIRTLVSPQESRDWSTHVDEMQSFRTATGTK